MREILFRGKRADNGEWVYGYLIQYNERHYIYYQKPDEMCQTGSWLTGERVIPETVGQYTGLTDKNGKRIFEGDIVKVYIKGYCTICTVGWAETVAHFQLWQINTIPKTPTNLNLGNYDCEVIGNIHDNPELLKGEKENELEKNCNRKTKRL